MFTNVFVNPASYRAFVGSGRWPDKTIFMLEVRHTGTDRRPNRAGLFQAEAVGLEAHVLDAVEGRLALLRLRRQERRAARCRRRRRATPATPNTARSTTPSCSSTRSCSRSRRRRARIKPGFDLDGGAQALSSGASRRSGRGCAVRAARPQSSSAPGRSPRPHLAFRLQPRPPVPAQPRLLRRSAGRLPGGQGARAWTWSPSPITTASTAGSSC